MHRKLLLIGFGVVGKAVYAGLVRDKNNTIDVIKTFFNNFSQ